jgi:hypothetical protein
MLKIKRSNGALNVTNDGDVAVLPLTNLQEAIVAIDTLTKGITTVVHQNYELQQSIMLDEETYSIKSSEAVFSDATRNVGTAVTKALKSALATAPLHLQGEQTKATVSAVAAVYAEVADMLIAAQGSDNYSIAKSLLAKSTHIKRDLDLVEDALNAPMLNVKRIKAEKALRSELTEKGIKIGSQRERYKMANVDNDVLDTAQAIVAAKKVTDTVNKRKDDILKNAKRVSRS